MIYFTYLGEKSCSQSHEHLMAANHTGHANGERKQLAGDVPMEASERGTGRRGGRGCHWLQSGEGYPSGRGK